jgi:predicted transposase YdaD
MKMPLKSQEKMETIPKLYKLNLTTEQIADSLDLSMEVVAMEIQQLNAQK